MEFKTILGPGGGLLQLSLCNSLGDGPHKNLQNSVQQEENAAQEAVALGNLSQNNCLYINNISLQAMLVQIFLMDTIGMVFANIASQVPQASWNQILLGFFPHGTHSCLHNFLAGLAYPIFVWEHTAMWPLTLCQALSILLQHIEPKQFWGVKIVFLELVQPLPNMDKFENTHLSSYSNSNSRNFLDF